MAEPRTSQLPSQARVSVLTKLTLTKSRHPQPSALDRDNLALCFYK